MTAVTRLVAPDPGPMARLREIVGMPGTMGEIVQRVTDSDKPQTLKQIARAWQVPAGKLAEWITEDRERSEQYANALRFAAEQAALETLEIADRATPETAAVAKLQLQARQWLAPRLARDRFGDATEVKHTGAVSLIAVLSGMQRGVSQALPAEVDVTPTPAIEAEVPAEKIAEKVEKEQFI